MTTALEVAPTQLERALAERFARRNDGYWYPREPGEPLVRVQIDHGLYRIDRRRSPQADWLQLVEGVNGDFDADSFATWADSFALVAH